MESPPLARGQRAASPLLVSVGQVCDQDQGLGEVGSVTQVHATGDQVPLLQEGRDPRQ